ncbi:LysR family transcriptional regulator [Ureibacillus sp. GCM10028918]|uniref:LysR family transcriptional regulator n=1 Tax=Ureibacillus sp. GCM10028918 TaxID=3273429 RepID=UPI00361C3989
MIIIDIKYHENCYLRGDIINIELINTFIQVIRLGTISEAAKELNVVQTTVSQRIQLLERDLQIQLFERSRGQKRVLLTPLGEEFSKIAEEWHRLHLEALQLHNHHSHILLKVGGIDSAIQFILPPIFKKIAGRNKNITLNIDTLHSWNLYDEIERKNIDIAFSLLNRSHQKVVVEKYFSSPMVFIQHELNCNNPKKFVHPKELDSNNELFMPFSIDYQTWHKYWWDPNNTHPIRLDSIRVLLELISGPDKWAIVPLAIANEAKKIVPIEIFPLETPAPDYILYKLTHRNPTTLKAKGIEIFENIFKDIYRDLI